MDIVGFDFGRERVHRNTRIADPLQIRKGDFI